MPGYKRFDAFGDHSQLELKDITSGHIYDWLDAEQMTPRSKEGDKGHPKYPSEATINRYASAISAVLTFACESRLINGVPKLRYSKEFARDRYMTDKKSSSCLRCSMSVVSSGWWTSSMSA